MRRRRSTSLTDADDSIHPREARRACDELLRRAAHATGRVDRRKTSAGDRIQHRVTLERNEEVSPIHGEVTAASRHPVRNRWTPIGGSADEPAAVGMEHQEGPDLSEELAASNVNRVYSLAASCIAIFTFTLLFLYPRFESGHLDGLLFEITMSVMGLATFAFVFATLEYYEASRPGHAEDERRRDGRRGDRLWVVGCILLYLAPGLVVLSVGLLVVGSVWIALWMTYLVTLLRHYPRLGTRS